MNNTVLLKLRGKNHSLPYTCTSCTCTVLMCTNLFLQADFNNSFFNSVPTIPVSAFFSYLTFT